MNRIEVNCLLAGRWDVHILHGATTAAVPLSAPSQQPVSPLKWSDFGVTIDEWRVNNKDRCYKIPCSRLIKIRVRVRT